MCSGKSPWEYLIVQEQMPIPPETRYISASWEGVVTVVSNVSPSARLGYSRAVCLSCWFSKVSLEIFGSGEQPPVRPATPFPASSDGAEGVNGFDPLAMVLSHTLTSFPRVTWLLGGQPHPRALRLNSSPPSSLWFLILFCLLFFIFSLHSLPTPSSPCLFLSCSVPTFLSLLCC